MMNTDDLTPMEAVVVEYFPTRPEEGELMDSNNKRVPGSCISQVVAAFTLLVCGSASLFFLASFSEEAFLATRKSNGGLLDSVQSGSKREYSYSAYSQKIHPKDLEEDREKALEDSFLKYAEMKASLGPVVAASRQRQVDQSVPAPTNTDSKHRDERLEAGDVLVSDFGDDMNDDEVLRGRFAEYAVGESAELPPSDSEESIDDVEGSVNKEATSNGTTIDEGVPGFYRPPEFDPEEDEEEFSPPFEHVLQYAPSKDSGMHYPDDHTDTNAITQGGIKRHDSPEGASTTESNHISENITAGNAAHIGVSTTPVVISGKSYISLEQHPQAENGKGPGDPISAVEHPPARDISKTYMAAINPGNRLLESQSNGSKTTEEPAAVDMSTTESPVGSFEYSTTRSQVSLTALLIGPTRAEKMVESGAIPRKGEREEGSTPDVHQTSVETIKSSANGGINVTVVDLRESPDNASMFSQGSWIESLTAAVRPDVSELEQLKFNASLDGPDFGTAAAIKEAQGEKAAEGTDDIISDIPTMVQHPIAGNDERRRKGETLDGEGSIEDMTNLINDGTDRDKVLRDIGEKMGAYMNNSVDPCEDFYEFACGRWDDVHPIPGDQTTINTFSLLRNEVEKAVRQLLEEPDDVLLELYNGSAVLKAKKYYQSCMDEEAIEAKGAEPLIDILDELGGWPILSRNWSEANFDWVETVTKLRTLHNSVLIQSWLGIDPGNSSHYALQLDQGSLFLGSADYYIKERFETLREKYYELVVDVALLLGADRDVAEEDARNMIDFETQIARAKTPREDRQTFFNIYKKISLENLYNYTDNGLNWTLYLTGMTFGRFEETDQIVVYDSNYFAKLVEIISLTDPRTVANYVLWMFASNRIKNLGRDFERVDDKFSEFATGRSTSPPRWQFCTKFVKGNWAHAIGALFVKRFYDEESLVMTNEMIDSLMEEFLALLKNSDWMDAVTRERAITKAKQMRRNIGYPEFMNDPSLVDEIYSNVTMTEDFMENQIAMIRHHAQLEMMTWGAGVNKSQWATPPTKVNAFYHVEKNQIMFPAGILQPPFFHKNFPKSLNFGGIGVVIGHEITHGFDDKGRSFDETGVLNEWWDKATEEKFLSKAKCVSDMYSKYHLPEVNLNLNGVTTRGENIADLGGMKVASRAYKRWLKEPGNADATIPGMNFTDEQLFFINYAQVWCANPRPQSLIFQIKQGRHTPGKYRILGTLASTPAFAEAFNCPPNAPMSPEERCEVW